MSVLPDRRKLIVLGLLSLAAVLALPLYADPGFLFLAGVTLIEAVFALSWALLFARTGLMVFGHAGFFAAGAYGVGFALKAGWPIPFPLLLVGTMLMVGLAAILLGLLMIGRVSGIALAILTLAMAEILRTLISYSTALGRDDGMSGIPRPALELGHWHVPLSDSANFYWFLCVACALLVLLIWWATYSRFGRVLACIRQDPERTAFLGHDIRRYRLAAFAIAAATAGGAGGLYAPWVGIITPEIGNVFHSTQPMLSTLLGGAGFFVGPVLGAVIFAEIGYVTRAWLGFSELITGGILLAIVLIAPSGLLGTAQRLWTRLQPPGSGIVSPAHRIGRQKVAP